MLIKYHSMHVSIPNHDYTRVIVTTMKDEAPYILDWVSYHLAIGFTHFVIFTNDCQDSTEQICKHLDKLGLATHVKNKPPYPKGIQKTAYERARRVEAVQKAEWLMALDVDEYLALNVGDGSLGAVFEMLPENTQALSFQWHMFGNAGVVALSSVPVFQEFKRASSIFQAMPYQIRGIKTLFRAQKFTKIGTHRPLNPVDWRTKDLWLNADGVRMTHLLGGAYWCVFTNGLGFSSALGRVNHYALRAREAYFLKRLRGFVNATNQGARMHEDAETYWRYFDWNNEEHTGILRKTPEFQAMKETLMDAEPKLARLGSRGLDFHKERFERESQDKAALWDEIQTLENRYDYKDYPDRLLTEIRVPWEFHHLHIAHLDRGSIWPDLVAAHYANFPKKF